MGGIGGRYVRVRVGDRGGRVGGVCVWVCVSHRGPGL